MSSSSVGVEVMIGRGSKGFHIDKTLLIHSQVPEDILSLDFSDAIQRGASAFLGCPSSVSWFIHAEDATAS